MTDRKVTLPGKPPADLGLCGLCRFSVPDGLSEMVLLNGQMLPLGAVRAAGQIIPADAPKISVLPCARYPKRELVPVDGWCGEWRPANVMDRPELSAGAAYVDTDTILKS